MKLLIAKILLPLSGFLFFIAIKVDNYILFFIITGTITGAIGFFMLTSAADKEIKANNKSFFTWKNKLLKHGLKFPIELNKCTVISNSYRQETTSENYSQLDKYKVLDSIAGRDMRTFENIKQSVIVYEQEINGERIKFYSDTIDKDEVTLQFYLSGQKKTWLYVDPLNMEDYYFDLSFLD